MTPLILSTFMTIWAGKLALWLLAGALAGYATLTMYRHNRWLRHQDEHRQAKHTLATFKAIEKSNRKGKK